MLELSRRLGVAYNTAWMLHAYIGGARSDGTTGRSASGKTPFLPPQWAQRHLVPGCVVHSDGWPGFTALAVAGHVHRRGPRF